MDYTELITLYPVEHEIKAMLSSDDATLQEIFQIIRFVAMEIYCTGAHTEILHFGSLLRVRARVLGNVPYGSSLTYVKKGQKA